MTVQCKDALDFYRLFAGVNRIQLKRVTLSLLTFYFGSDELLDDGIN